MGHAILERARLFGPQSADYITASGHSGRIVTEASLQAKTGRIHDRTRTLRSTVRFLLHRGHRPYMTQRVMSDVIVSALQNAVLIIWVASPPKPETGHNKARHQCWR
jgi:hypothetical protein